MDSARFAVSGEGELLYRPVSLLRGQTLERMGDLTGARSAYQAARALLEDSVAVHPGDPKIRIVDSSSAGWKNGTPFCVTSTPPGCRTRLQFP